MKTQVIITLGGTGKRFSDAGYVLPKYMLPINIFNNHYKVIDIITGMYLGKDIDIIYLCNKEHIQKYNLVGLLGDYGKVIQVNPGFGPGDAILQARESIDFSLPTFVQYCDTFQTWDFDEIKKTIETNNPDAAVIVTNEKCPSVFDGTLYGRVKIENEKIIDIKEKAETEYSDYLGCGTFYFKNGKLLLDYVKKQDENKELYYLNGESYINCTIKAMLDDSLNIIPININNYINLGVPRDYADFMYWQKLAYDLRQSKKNPMIHGSTLIMPAAGLGSRFKNSYEKPKPLIDVFDEPSKMFVESVRHSFNPENTIIVTRKDLYFYDEFKEEAERHGYGFVSLDKITEGQAITIKEGLRYIKNGVVSINSCDQGILFNESKFYEIYPEADVIVCGIKHYAQAINKPNSFSWIKANGTDVTEITSKRCDGDPKENYVFVSCLLYKNKSILEKSIDSLIERNEKTNGEYYIDESINDSIRLGYKVKLLEIDSYLNWGTPEELELFKWWIDFFNKTHFYDYMA